MTGARALTPQRRWAAAASAASLVATVLVLAAAPAAAAAPTCLVPGAPTAPGTARDNGDGTSSFVLVGRSDTATATITIPRGVSSVRLDACGAQGQPDQLADAGSNRGGTGGRSTGTLATDASTTTTLTVVTGTRDGLVGGGGVGPGGGRNGGGFSGVFLGAGSPSPASALVVAGGGGGATASGDGGAGGGASGAPGARTGAPLGASDTLDGRPGGGGSQTAGGPGGAGAQGAPPLIAAGQPGQGGALFRGGDGAGASIQSRRGAGGGGGLFGGGGGGAGAADGPGGSGGGGSGFVDTGRLTAAATGPSTRGGDGAVVLTFRTPVAPVFESELADEAVLGLPYDSTATVRAVPTAVLTVEGALPPGITRAASPDNAVRLSGTPTVPGTYDLTLIAASPLGVARQPERIVVSDVPAPTTPAASAATSPTASARPSASASPSAPAGRFRPVTPARVLDTRTDATPVAAGADRRVQVTGRGGIPVTGVTAVVLNVTATGATRRGDLQVYPTGQRPATRTSNLNFFAGETVPVQVQSGVSSDGSVTVSVNTGAVHVVVDVFGYYTAEGDPVEGSSGYAALQPQRLLDTRTATRPVQAGADITVPVSGRLGVPLDATAVALNATALATPGNADVSVYPSGAQQSGRTSNLNLRRGQTKANAVTSALGPDGSVKVSVSQASAHVVLDVLGYYSPGSGGRFIPVTPERVLDTRTEASSLAAGADRVVPLGGQGGVPAGAQAVVLSVTGTGASAPVDLQVFPTDDRPDARTSTLNLRPGEAIANLAVATLGSGDAVTLSLSQGRAAVVLDVVGYLTVR